MNETKRIDNPRIKIVKCVGALKMKTCVESLQKQTVGLIFNIKKLSVFELALTDRINLSGTRPKSACSKYSSCQFSFSATRNAITKATVYVTYGFLRLLGKFERHCKRYGILSV